MRTIHIERFATRLGAMLACANEQGLCLLEFSDRRMLPAELEDLEKRFEAAIVAGSTPVIESTKRQVAEYLAGERQQFSLPVDAPGSEFQERVWNVLQTIPYGETWSYAEQARRLGQPNATRAVARANGSNRIALVIPCHRVVGSDGSLTGYAAGLPRKRWLLEMEARNRKS